MKFNNQTLIIVLAAAGVGYWLYTNKQKGKGTTDEEGGSGGGGGGLPLPPIFPNQQPPAPIVKPVPKYTATKTNVAEKVVQQTSTSQAADPNKLKRIVGVTISGSTPTGTGSTTTGLPPSGFSSGVFGGFSGKEPLTINNLLM